MGRRQSLTSPQFKALVVALSHEIVNAHISYRFWKELGKALAAAPDVVAQSRAFWGHTVQAHLDSCLSHLGRVYDKHKDALHMENWLLAIRDNANLYSHDSFRERLQDNPHVSSLARSRGALDLQVLDADIVSCRRADPDVHALIYHRDKAIAHRSMALALEGKHPGQNVPFGTERCERLLARATEVFNRYSLMFDANAYSNQLIGHDDYKFIIRSVQEAVDASRQRSADWLRSMKLVQQYPDL